MSSTRPPLNVIAEVLDFDELTAVRTSAEGILAKVESGTRGGDVFNFAETVWPAAVGSGPFTPELLLIPLSRLGAVQGFSGNRVMIGYFVDRGMTILPSRPMVVKISAKGDAEKLLDERNRANAVRLHLAYYPGEFALPLQCETIGDYAVLWSPFSSSTPLLRTFRRHAASRLALGIEDLWFHLRSSPSRPASHLSAALSGQKAVTAEDTLLDPVKDPTSVRGKEPDLVDAIEHIYEILKSLHLRSGRARREKRSLIVEYRRYLRGVSDWGAAWHSIWAPPEEKTIRIGAEEHLNPLWVLGRIETIEEQNLFCGAVQGICIRGIFCFRAKRRPMSSISAGLKMGLI